MSFGSERGPPVAVLASAFAATPSPMLVTDARAPDNPIIWANEAFLRLTGYAFGEIQGRNCRLLQGPDTDRSDIGRLRSAVAAGEPVAVELLNYRKDGTSFWNALTVTPVHDDRGLAYFFSAQTDTSRARRSETATATERAGLERRIVEQTTDLRAALEEKAAVIQEIDHRVKNNLQVISSLMLLKARRTPAGEARTALDTMAERIGALSIAHRLIQAEGDGSQFDLRDFVAELLSDLNAGLPDERIRIDSTVEAIALPAAMAAPLALMIHELAANAVRHAYPGDRQGTVTVAARRADGGMHVEVRDDGIGLDASTPDWQGFGGSLVDMVVRQLRGDIRWLPAEPGTTVTIDVPIPGTR